MATIASLVVSLSANSAKFTKELQRSRKSAKTWAKQVRGQVNRVGVAFAAMGTAAAAGLAVLIQRQGQSIDALAKMSAKIGLTTEALAGLQLAGELTGVGINTTNMALQRMTRRVAEAARGTGEAKDAIAELGLDAKELVRLSPDQMFARFADAMKGVGNQADRVRLAMKLFDSEGVSLVSTLAMGSEGLRQAEAEARKFGIALSAIDTKAVENQNDALTRMGKAVEGVKNRIAVGLAPHIEALAKHFTAAALESDGFGNAIERSIEFAGKAVGFLGDGFRLVQLVAKNVTNTFRILFAVIIRNIHRANVLATDLMNLFGADIEAAKLFGDIADVLEEQVAKAKQSLNDLATAELPSVTIQKHFDRIKQEAQAAAAAAEAQEKQVKDASATLANSAAIRAAAEADATDSIGKLGQAAAAAARGLGGGLQVRSDSTRPTMQSRGFNSYARAAQKAYNQGDQSSFERMRSMAKELYDSSKKSNFNYDLEGMQEKLKKLGVGKSETVGTIVIKTGADTLELKGEASASASFLRQLKTALGNEAAAVGVV
jgi:hypothetical protein